MKHYEKKLKELIEHAPVVLDCFNNYSHSEEDVEILMKKYAEYLVQQERERILKRAETILEAEREYYGTDKYGLSIEQLREICTPAKDAQEHIATEK